MTPKLSAIALFCEDAREEQGGLFSLIGVMPDNIEVPEIPGLIPKLAIYVRVNLEVGYNPRSLMLWLQGPNEVKHELTEFEADMIEKTRQQASADNNTIAGLQARAVSAPFPVFEEGRVQVILDVDGAEQVIGSVNFKKTEASGSSSASPQPSGQSQPAAPGSSSPRAPSPRGSPKKRRLI